MTMFLCMACIGGIVWAVDAQWPWWSLVPLALGAVLFFFAEADDE